MEILRYNNSLDIVYKKQKYTVTVGDTFQRLTVTELVNYKDNSGTSRKGCICKCICGNNIGPSRLHMLFNGELVSCSCYRSEIHSKQLTEKNFKHGEAIKDSRSKLYSLWVSMTDRARNANRPDSQYYALKGITVCDDWLDYVKFKEWAMNRCRQGL